MRYFVCSAPAKRFQIGCRTASNVIPLYIQKSLLTTVELFSGIGGFRLAADRISLKTLWANDVSADACHVYRSCFGSSELVEDRLQAVKSSVPLHDILTAGFPCQPFSSAGKKSGVRDPRGTLFHEIVDIIAARQPSLFVLENVKRLLTMERGEHFATILAALTRVGYSVEWRVINAMNLGLPQNRQRIFLSGVRCREGREPSLRLCTQEETEKIPDRLREKLASRNRWSEIHSKRSRFRSWGVAQNDTFFTYDLEPVANDRSRVHLASVLEPSVPSTFDFTNSTMERIADSEYVGRIVDGVEILYNQRGGARMGYTVFGINGVAPTLTSTASRHYERYKVGGSYRRLTPTEYARIQGFPDKHCDIVPAGKRYALLGNAVPPIMAEWAMKKTLGRGIQLSEIKPSTAISLFPEWDA